LFAIQPESAGIHGQEGLPVFAKGNGGVHPDEGLHPGVVPRLTRFSLDVAFQLA
jgi:hypothetical protein